MAKKKDISVLPKEEQAKILKKRAAARAYFHKRKKAKAAVTSGSPNVIGAIAELKRSKRFILQQLQNGAIPDLDEAHLGVFHAYNMLMGRG